MAERKPLVNIDGQVQEMPSGDTISTAIAPGGGSSTIEIEDVGKVDLVPASLLSSDVGRVFGLKSISPVELGLLNTDLPVNPIGGGTDILFDQTFTPGSPANGFVVPNVDKYERVILYGWYVDPNDTVFFEMSADGGSTVISHPFATSHYVNNAGSLSWNAVEVTQPNFSFIDNRDNTHFSMEIDGISSNMGYVRTKVERQSVFGGNQQLGMRNTLHGISNVNALVFRTNSGAAVIDGGRIVAVGIKASVQPMAVQFSYTGNPAGVETLARYIAPVNQRIAAGNQGSFVVEANPTAAETVNIKQNGTTIGTISIATNGACTVNITTQTDISKNDLIILESTSAADFAGLHGSLLMVARDA